MLVEQLQELLDLRPDLFGCERRGEEPDAAVGDDDPFSDETVRLRNIEIMDKIVERFCPDRINRVEEASVTGNNQLLLLRVFLE